MLEIRSKLFTPEQMRKEREISREMKKQAERRLQIFLELWYFLAKLVSHAGYTLIFTGVCGFIWGFVGQWGYSSHNGLKMIIGGIVIAVGIILAAFGNHIINDIYENEDF